mmetsp:Transcript_45649/g.74436  ORF Transcript_45649/g.74436 Transcript_45649/m.74436 type:complete len:808 (-) Transcript_45649:597-3020(-)|eukprot:CAMPEP_0184670256 /NCGR_PEP_ID=MMETSP0308-20130426/81455_1 /TAXON_ID=38269 /ORGANISM="Gloeochaete witrockiana, Strain SAG 46.84" /LENGTH=807 /DNA_ID=CAMNT_0027116925 /DNA_START=92 /DNA_END=2515 /DNA_ORIENTATION=-
MPVRGLQDFLQRYGRAESARCIRDGRIGVDGGQWLRKIFSGIASREVFHVAMGGLPLTALNIVHSELEKFANMGIKPFFVFQGPSIRKDRPQQDMDPKAQSRARAWEAYANGDVRSAMGLFGTAGGFITTDLINAVFKYFTEHDVEYMRAPYLSGAQLAWMASLENRLLGGIFSGPELVLFEAGTLILDIDPLTQTVFWVDVKSMLKHLDVSYDQFLDACLLAGFDFLPTFPPLNPDFHSEFRFDVALEMIRHHRTGFRAIQTHNTHPQVAKMNYTEQFLKARALIRHHLVWEPSCVCEPLHKTNIPMDLDEIVGPRLPVEIYYFLSQGIINTQVINTMLTGLLVELPPLVDSAEYRNMLGDATLQLFRTQTLSILLSTLHESFRNKRIVSVHWFDHQNEHRIQIGESPLAHHHKWQLPDAEIRSEVSRQAALSKFIRTPSGYRVVKGGPAVSEGSLSEMSGVGFVVQWRCHRLAPVPAQFKEIFEQQIKKPTMGPPTPPAIDPRTGKGRSPGPNASPPSSDDMPKEDGLGMTADGSLLTTPDEFLCHILLHSLQVRQFFDYEQKPTTYGQALDMAGSFEEETWLALELIRGGYLTTERLHNPPHLGGHQSFLVLPLPPNAIPGRVPYEAETTLISRVFSLLPMTFKEGMFWESRVDHDLMGFNCIVKTIHRSLRNLLEVVMLAAFLRHHARLSPKEYLPLSFRLPFFQDTNTAMGVVAKSFLQDDAQKIENMFPACKNPVGDLLVAFEFWDKLFQIVMFLWQERAVSDELFDSFNKADQFLRLKRSENGLMVPLMPTPDAYPTGRV